jgi:SAM-dependent methyltransferase
VDIIVSNIALHHLQDDQKSLAARELFRVLSLDGCIVLGDPATREKHRWLARKKAWVQHMRNSNWPARLKIAGFAIKWAFYFSFINRLRPMEFIITGEEWMKILDNAGFRDLKCDYSDPLVNVIYGEKHK